jgi:two-component system CheB/CheR fusion protein
MRDMTEDSSATFPVVGIGASAGGIDAFHQFFNNMPADCGMAFVMILHLPANYKSMLSEIVARWTSMPVVRLSPGDRIAVQPNHVYVPDPHLIVKFSDGHLQMGQHLDESPRLFRPIDDFFDALGATMRERAVGIVLSGTGTDGALGLKALRKSGGFTIAQGTDGLAPQYGEMPDGAIATGAVDLVSLVQDMPDHLLRLKGRLPPRDPGAEDGARSLDEHRLEICSILHRHLNHDFSDYRSQTFLRRVERRMAVTDVPTIEDYIVKLRSDASEVKLLFLDLLIRVTSFFRDTDTFATLATEVIPQLFRGKGANSTVRVWVPGCSTGEEAYSLAMLLREQLDSLSAAPTVQVFATDIDEAAIGTARLGRYPKTLLDGLSDERRQRFFKRLQGSYVVTKEIRDLCTFSPHNLIRDPPFSMMSLISCRNLLIYMNPTLQQRVIPVFHYSLVPGGILLLGGSESVAQHSDLFDIVDKKSRIFRRREGRSSRIDLQWRRPEPGSSRDHATDRMNNTGVSASNVRPVGNAGQMLQAVDSDRERRIDDLLADTSIDADIVGRLKAALLSAREELHTLAAQRQTAIEELRSSNEELHSVNEEMQSTNEELETSKEELQSLNEELHTVNVRLSEKIDELDQANNDLRNLFDSTQIATVFLDRHLVIRNFTPAIADIYNLIPSDQGRSLTDIVSSVRYTSLQEDAAHVLSKLQPLERRIVRSDGTAHYIMRLLPYREPDSSVSGVLLTFVDVTSITRAEEALVAADVRKDVFLATLSHELRNPLAPIRNAAQLLQSPNVPRAELARAQAIINRQVKHLATLLDDLLDISRITRGSFPLRKAYVDIRTVVDEARESVQSSLDAKEHTLRMELPEATMTVDVDPVRLTQAITNLLTNAVKYTPAKGLIVLSVRVDGRFLVIAVRDNGIGLTSEATKQVFGMFTRIESDSTPSEGGLGIGLALAKGLVQLHGGRLEVHSAGLGQGSEFSIRLPKSVIVEKPRVLPGAEEAKPTKQPRRVLVVDDNRDAAESLGMILNLYGHEVELAHSGMRALEIANSRPPDIGVLDIGMPDLSGYEVAERIRDEEWGKNVTLIALTGWGQESDKQRALLAGFDHHLTKPIDPEQLKRLFDSL